MGIKKAEEESGDESEICKTSWESGRCTTPKELINEFDKKKKWISESQLNDWYELGTFWKVVVEKMLRIYEHVEYLEEKNLFDLYFGDHKRDEYF